MCTIKNINFCLTLKKAKYTELFVLSVNKPSNVSYVKQDASIKTGKVT